MNYQESTSFERGTPSFEFGILPFCPLFLTTPSFWRFFVRLQLQNAITEKGWRTYLYCLYGASALVLVLLAITLWLHFALKSRTRFRIQWPSHLLRMVICITMTTLQVRWRRRRMISRLVPRPHHHLPTRARLHSPRNLPTQTSFVLLFTVVITCGGKASGRAMTYFPDRSEAGVVATAVLSLVCLAR